MFFKKDMLYRHAAGSHRPVRAGGPRGGGFFTPDKLRAAVGTAAKVYKAGSLVYDSINKRRNTPRTPIKVTRIPKSAKRKEYVRSTAKRFGASQSRTSGFFKLKKQGRKNRLKGAMAATGVHATYEHGSVLSAPNIIYAGHATGPRDIIMKHAWQAILKTLMMQMKLKIVDFNDVLPFQAGDTFIWTYFLNPQDITTSFFSYITVAASTWNSVAYAFANTAFGTANLANVVPLSFSYIPNTSSVFAPFSKINLQYGMLHFKIKSAMKTQNRTVNAVGDIAFDDVDNVPIDGLTIGGNGTGCEALFANSAAAPGEVVCSMANGTIDKTTLDSRLFEPLSGFWFPKSKTQGKLHLDPGQIKTNVLYTDRRISLAYLYKIYWSNAGTVMAPFGHYMFMQLEKMIDTGVAINLLLAYETNLAINVSYTAKNNWTTASQYAKF